MSIPMDSMCLECQLRRNAELARSLGKIETVVFFDNNTGDAWYEVVDKETRQPVPNVEKPDNMYIGDLDIRWRIFPKNMC